MALWQWLKTISGNAGADPTINWAEGMAPASINDSGRAMMASVAQWRDDISGTITTSGTLTDYTLASNQGFDTLAHMNGAMIAFVPHITCGVPVTLNVDGLGAKPLRTSPGIEVGAATLIQGTPYAVTYNNSDGVFYLQNFFGSSFVVPVGGMIPYLGSTAPNSNFVLPFGQAISRAAFATLFALTGTAFGAGDGTTTFNVPDMRDRAPFGLGNMGGVDAGRITVAGGNFDGAVIGGTGGAQNHTLTTAEMPAHSHTATTTENGAHSFFQGPATSIQGAAGSGNLQPSAVAAISLTTTIDNAGSGGAHTSMPPAIMLPYILRVI